METPAPQSDPVAKSDKTVHMLLGSLLMVILLGLAVYFVTRTTEEDRALQAVCTSRADVLNRVESLASTTITNFTLGGFEADVNAIESDVSTIRENTAKLSSGRKQEIGAANQQFESALVSTLTSLGVGLSLENAQAKLKIAGERMIDAYKTTLQPIDCSGVDLNG